MNGLKYVYLIVIAVFAMTAMGCEEFISTPQYFDHRELAATTGGKLKVDSMGGSINIKTHDKPTVIVDSAMRARQGYSTDVGNLLEVTCDATDGNVTVIVRWKEGHNALNADVGGRLTLLIPESYSIDSKTGGGDIAAGAIQGSVKANTGGGRIRLNHVLGAITGNTGGGDINVDTAAGDASLSTGGGTIRLDHVVGDITAKTGGGDLKFSDITGGIKGHTGGGSIRVTIAKQSDKPISLSTGGGDINLTLPSDFKANLSAKSASGDVTCELTMQGTMRQSGFQGKVNGGGPDVTLDTSGGSIKILSAHP